MATFKSVMRLDSSWPKLRLFRVMWQGPQKTAGGWPVSHKFAVAFRPRLFRFQREFDGWRLVVLGIEMHRQSSHGGRFV